MGRRVSRSGYYGSSQPRYINVGPWTTHGYTQKFLFHRRAWQRTPPRIWRLGRLPEFGHNRGAGENAADVHSWHTVVYVAKWLCGSSIRHWKPSRTWGL